MFFDDVTDSSDNRVDYPEYVDGFINIGFVQVGRVLARDEELSDETLSAPHGDRSDIVLAHMTTPTPVLRAPNAQAFVEVSWFFDNPSIRIRTQFDDGFLVETLRRWDNPPWDRTGADIDKLMMKNHGPDRGRSTQLVSSSDCAALWLAHLDHVSAIRMKRASSIQPHENLAEYTSITSAAFERDTDYSYDSAERFPVGENQPTSHLWEHVRPMDQQALVLAVVGALLLLAVIVAVAV